MIAPAPRLGLRANAAQFALLVLVNALVGATLGLERSLLPLLAERSYGLSAATATLSFVAVFGVSKALANAAAGRLADRLGRKPVLVAGWLVAVPFPLMLMWAPSWPWVLAANVLLGVSQGLTWSATVVMKIDLAGPARRGLAMGLNEFAGYAAVALTAWLTAAVAHATHLGPQPFWIGVATVLLGLVLSAVAVRDTHGHAAVEAAPAVPAPAARRTIAKIRWIGLVNNLNDGLAWGLFPLLYARAGLDLAAIGALVAIYPAVWGLAQLATGPLSDRVGRRGPIAFGMWIQAVGIGVVAVVTGTGGFAIGNVLLGLGTALVYPTLLAAIGDVAHPSWRASAVGTYRLWRDLGYPAGALVAGVAADTLGLAPAVWVVAAVTFAAGWLAPSPSPEVSP